MPGAQIMLPRLPVRLKNLRGSGKKMLSCIQAMLDMLAGRRCWTLWLLLLGCQSSHGQEARFNLSNVNVSQAAAVFQEFTGQAIVLASDVSGAINVFSSTPLSKREALVLFATALKEKGMTLHHAAGEIMVTRMTSFSPRTAREWDGVIETRIFTLQHLGVAEVSPAVRALLSPHGAISARNNSTLIVSDKYSALLGVTQYLMAADSAKERSSTQLECSRILDAAGLLQRHFSVSPSRIGLDAASDMLWGRQLHALILALENGAGCENDANSEKELKKRPPGGGLEQLNQATLLTAHERPTEGAVVQEAKNSIQPGLRQDMTGASDDATNRALGIALENWRQAWSRRDLTAYFDFYAPHFLPPNESSLDAWKKKRKLALARAVEVSIDITDFSLNLSGATQATMVFTQTYRSKHYRDVATKTLQWVYVEGRWLIARESVVKDRSGAEMK